jgi:hypothetical protein
MAGFLLEGDASLSDPDAVEACAAHDGRPEQLGAEGTPVRYLRSIYVSEEETCFYLYESGFADAVREVAGSASLPSRTWSR